MESIVNKLKSTKLKNKFDLHKDEVITFQMIKIFYIWVSLSYFLEENLKN